MRVGAFNLTVGILLSGSALAQDHSGCYAEPGLLDRQCAEFTQIADHLKDAPSVLEVSALRSWGPDARLPCAPPFAAVFRKGARSVTFLAVDHLAQPEDPAKSPLLRKVREEIESTKPGAVLIESVTGGVLPRSAMHSFSSGCDQGKKFVCGEAAYAARIADKVDAEVSGGEPIPPLRDEALLKALSREEALALLSTQTILGLKRQGVPSVRWPEMFAKEFSKNVTFESGDWSFARFESWLSKNLRRRPSEVVDGWLEPRSDAGATVLQRAAFVADRVREPLILKAAERVINSHPRSLIVYGAGHYYKQAPAFERAFGAPQLKCFAK